MIIKSLSRKENTAQLLAYLFAKEEKLSIPTHKPLIIKHNVRGTDLKAWVKEFDKNETYRLRKRSDNVKMFHTILSFSNKDHKHISEKILRDIAKYYISIRGKDNMYIGTAHYDKDHIHLHIAMSGTKYITGESNRITRLGFQEIKLAMDTYQKEKYPELIHSLPNHSKTKQNPELLKNTRAPEKEKLLTTLNSLYTKSKSLDDFINKISKKGYEAYYRAGKLTGLKTEQGLKFRFNRLGFTPEKLSEIDIKNTKEQAELDEIQKLRNRSKERDRDTTDLEIER